MALLALASSSCGAATAPGQPDVPEPASRGDAATDVPPGSCTGTVPAHASPCPGADVGLTADVPRTLQAACACDASCRATTPCSYTCDAGFVLRGGACEAFAPEEVTFTDRGDGTIVVTDPHGPVVWLKTASCRGVAPWPEAAAWTAALSDGACGLSDGSAPGDWKLPTPSDLGSLAADLASPAYAATAVRFVGVASIGSWSDFTTCINVYGEMDVTTGRYADVAADSPFNVWPVHR